MKIIELPGGVRIEGLQDFDLDIILDCGQCFLWNKDGDVWSGVVGGRVIRATQQGESVAFLGADRAFFDGVLHSYFDLDCDYGTVKKVLACDPTAHSACAFAPGMRILRQDSFEALCCFILSQNNNIKRIKKIVSLLCSHFGEEIESGYFSFPTPQRLAGLTNEDLAPIRCGFRAAYLLDAARKVASGEVNLNNIRILPIEEARQELQKISGVGPKVADCALLYGMYRLEAFPVDVWIKRALDRFYPLGLPEEAKKYAGIAQQYLFHYVRCCPDALADSDKA